MNLLTPFTLSTIPCKNRIGMAAMSRQRCDNKEMIPTKLMKTYYMQRATAGFIITEGLPLSMESIAQEGSSGIFTQEQAQSWKDIVNSLHQSGTKVIAQLWHCGRVTSLVEQPLAPSAIKFNQYNCPKEMNIDEINLVIKQYVNCAMLIKDSGFDGIEIQASSGYLLDSFLKQSTNLRKDSYGGSIENRCRFLLAILEKVSTVFNPQLIGVKLSPITRQYGSFDDNPKALYSYLASELNKRNIGFIEIRDDDYPDNWYNNGFPGSKSQIPNVFEFFRPLFKGSIIGNGKLTPDSAEKLIEQGLCDAVTFGRLYIANPNLIERIQKKLNLNELDQSTLLSGGSKGYIDYQ